MQKISKQQVKSVGLKKKEKKLKSNIQFSLYQNQKENWLDKTKIFVLRCVS